ncbi:MAG: tetratricopeptide repeat protein, partial [Nitrospirae bacterium]|nr:tetratricopeptide repeat protein [Nitrospirota bacterium]
VKVSEYQSSEDSDTMTLGHSDTHLVALFSALIFVSHPIQTQAVTYIVQRFASLATFFYLLSLVMYIKFRIHDSRYTIQDKKNHASCIMYLASLFSAVLAMKTKEIAFTLPIIITLYEFMFFEGKIKRRILYLIPLLLTMLIIPLSLIKIGGPTVKLTENVGEATRFYSLMSRWDYLFTQPRVITTYIRLLFLPINQNLDYDYPTYNTFLNPEVPLSFLFLLSIFGLGIYLLYRSRFSAFSLQPSAFRLIAFGIFWFSLTILLESSIIPLNSVIFEHRAYLPSIGFIIVSCIVVSHYASRVTHYASRFFLTTVHLLLTTLVIILSIATYQRNTVWQDKVSLLEDAIKKSPRNGRVHQYLATAYLFNGQIDKAIEQYQITVKLWPNYALSYYLLGNAYEKKGLVNEAIEQYRIAIQLKPDFTDAYLNLLNAYIGNGLNRQGNGIKHQR